MDKDERAIREVVTSWMSATKAGDNEKVLSLMSDEVIFLMAGHEPMVGKGSFATNAPMEPNQFEGTSEIKEVKVLGEWAYTWTKLSVVVNPPGGGRQIKRSGNTLSIFRKENGRWVLYRDANMLTEEKNS
jgi:uncharacterized protein (TIGR02246 family)